MAIDWEKLGLTKRARILLGVLALVLAAYFFVGREPEPPAARPVAAGTVGGAPAGAARPAQAAAGEPAVALEPVTAGRDPFQVPAAYRQTDQKAVTQTAGTRPPEGPAATPQALPQLMGTVISDAAGIAILASGNESRSVRIGERFEAYTLVAVDANSAVLDGPGGPTTLRMGR